MFYLNHYKDSPEEWSVWPNKEETERCMKFWGGFWTVREGEEFDSKWIEEERRDRESQ